MTRNINSQNYAIFQEKNAIYSHDVEFFYHAYSMIQRKRAINKYDDKILSEQKIFQVEM